MLPVLPKYKKSDGEYDLFKDATNDSDIHCGIDNVRDATDDEAYTLAKQL